MILDEYVIIIPGKNKQYYIDKGYIIDYYKDPLSILIKDLQKGSNIKIRVKCDICENEKELSYAKYNKNISKYGCKVSTKDKKFEPNDEAKGMAARACAYILTRYQWLLPRMNELIDIKTMVEWHEKYPPSEPEKKREAEIFKVQKNHNPYITQSASYMREVWLG